VGLPVVVTGVQVYRGAIVIVPPEGGDIEAAIPRGWVDLREASCATWVARAKRILEQDTARQALPPGSGSGENWFGIRPTDPIEPSRFATWIFKYEDEGERIKR